MPVVFQTKRHAGAAPFPVRGTTSMPRSPNVVRRLWAGFGAWRPPEVGVAAYSARAMSPVTACHQDSSAPDLADVGRKRLAGHPPHGRREEAKRAGQGSQRRRSRSRARGHGGFPSMVLAELDGKDARPPLADPAPTQRKSQIGKIRLIASPAADRCKRHRDVLQ